jgi:hypothetical protein
MKFKISSYIGDMLDTSGNLTMVLVHQAFAIGLSLT